MIPKHAFRHSGRSESAPRSFSAAGFWRGVLGLLRFQTPSGWHAPDQALITALVVLLITGIVMLASASNVIGWQTFGDPYFFVKHQLLYGLLIGSFALVVVSRVDYHLWKNYAFVFMMMTLVLLLLVLLPGVGVEYGGSQSWIDVGLFSFQPAEIAKLTFLIYLATWLTNQHRKDVRDVSTSFLPFAVIFGFVALLIVLQKDFGTLTVFAAIALLVYFVAGGAVRHILVLGVGGVMVFLLLIQSSAARVARFTVFLHPEVDPQGIGYQVNQAMLAVGSGGLFGQGLGHSRQKFNYLPEVVGDSIFAVVAEELGFVLTMLIVLLIAWFIVRCLRVSRAAPDEFGRLLAVGIAVWIGFQSFVNIAGMLSLLPLTGLPLPFMSYGSTSLISMMIAMGIVINISRQTSQHSAPAHARLTMKRAAL